MEAFGDKWQMPPFFFDSLVDLVTDGTSRSIHSHVPASSPEWELESQPQLTVADRRFAEIYEEYAAFVWRTLRRFGVDLSSLEDATQDVFLVAHRRLNDFDGAFPRAWLAAIARRVAADTRRKMDQHRGVSRDSQHEIALNQEALKKCADDNSPRIGGGASPSITRIP